MPIHNEQDYLPFSLASILNAELDELVVVLDKCTDNSKNIILNFADRVSYKVRIIELTERFWRYRTAEPFSLGFSNAKGEIVYSLAGDCIYDPRIFEIDWSDIEVASFHYFDYCLYGTLKEKLKTNWFNFYKWLKNIVFSKLTKKPRLCGIYGFKKYVFEEIGISRDVMSEDVWFLRQARKRKFKYRYFPDFYNLHLRPGTLNLEWKHFMQGEARVTLNYPLWKVIGNTVITMRPNILRGYLSAKRKRDYG